MKYVLISTLFSFISFGKIYVISDIDDTIKQSNTMSCMGMVDYFLRNLPFKNMAKLYQNIRTHYETIGEDVEFYYVSASYNFTYKAKNWVPKNGFPQGEYYQRSLLSGDKKVFKKEIIEKILKEKSPEDRVLFFGDNSQKDEEVYLSFLDDQVEIYVRDIRARALKYGDLFYQNYYAHIKYFLTEYDLLNSSLAPVVDQELLDDIFQQLENKSLIPEYVKAHFLRKVQKAYCKGHHKLKACKKNYKKRSEQIWDDYYTFYY